MLKKALCCLMIPSFMVVSSGNITADLSTEKDNSKVEKLINRETLLKEQFEDKVTENLIQKQKEIKDSIESYKQNKKLKEELNKIDFELTFYGSVECVGGTKRAITCNGVKPYEGIVASNHYPQGTIIHLDNWGTVVVGDRGGSDFDDSARLDVYVSVLPGESDSEYQKRIDSMGRLYTKGRVIIKE